ncbi:TPA_asm: hypothetical protein G0D50_24630 [Salmonella enterica subsp. enterica serovar Dublin]|nr:hypothetical protein [Salmonella enterica subsp. enterica serovar Dublin]
MRSGNLHGFIFKSDVIWAGRQNVEVSDSILEILSFSNCGMNILWFKSTTITLIPTFALNCDYISIWKNAKRINAVLPLPATAIDLELATIDFTHQSDAESLEILPISRNGIACVVWGRHS